MIDIYKLTRYTKNQDPISKQKSDIHHTYKDSSSNKLNIFKYLSRCDQKSSEENLLSPNPQIQLPRKKFKIVSSQKVLTPLILSKTNNDKKKEQLGSLKKDKSDKKLSLTPLLTRDPNRKVSSQMSIKITHCDTQSSCDPLPNLDRTSDIPSIKSSKKLLSPLIDSREEFSFTSTFMKDASSKSGGHMESLKRNSLSNKTQTHKNIIQQIKSESFISSISRNVRSSLQMNISSFNFATETRGTLSESHNEDQMRNKKGVNRIQNLNVQKSFDFEIGVIPNKHKSDMSLTTNFENVEELHFFYFQLRKSEKRTSNIITESPLCNNLNEYDTVIQVEERDFD